jgi:hypothetical protein
LGGVNPALGRSTHRASAHRLVRVKRGRADRDCAVPEARADAAQRGPEAPATRGQRDQAIKFAAGADQAATENEWLSGEPSGEGGRQLSDVESAKPAPAIMHVAGRQTSRLSPPAQARSASSTSPSAGAAPSRSRQGRRTPSRCARDRPARSCRRRRDR